MGTQFAAVRAGHLTGRKVGLGEVLRDTRGSLPWSRKSWAG